MNRAVFLDRDGVLNRAVLRDGRLFAPATAAELELTPGAAAALARLKDAGFLLIVVTNQPDVARGIARREDIDTIHRIMRESLPLDGIRVCFHDDADGCACRKPAPGMLIADAVEREVRLRDSFIVGDRWRDIGAGRAAGCRTILIESGVSEDTIVVPDHTAATLGDAVEWILANQRPAGQPEGDAVSWPVIPRLAQ